jgi:membrane associated rhomboid family serine protease/Zn-finger nucleic acid-binding protein
VNLAIFRKTVKADTMRAFWLNVLDVPEVAHHEALSCPACAKRMARASATGSHNEEIQLDVCRACHMMWVDHGELEMLPLQPHKEAAGSRKLSPEAAEALAPMLAETERAKAQTTWDETTASRAPDDPWHALLTFFGFPVEENAPAQRVRPWITWTILGLCILATAGPMVSGQLEEMIQRNGFIPNDPWRNGGATLLTSFFLHAGWLHLIFNMWFLWVAGDNCEDLLGARRFMLLVFGGALIAAGCHAVFDPRPGMPLVGASGGISALLGFYAFALPHVRLVVCWRIGWYPVWIRLKVAHALVLWVLGQMIGLVMQLSGTSSVSSLAHLGGVFAGVGFWLLWRKRLQPL